MGCCDDSTEVQPLKVNGRQFSPQGKDGQEFDGPVKSRNCTDILCLMLFLAFCIGGAIYLFVAYTKGDPNRIIHGYDKKGNICGHNNSKIANVSGSGQDKTNMPYFMLLDRYCVSNCPNSSTKKIAYYCFPLEPNVTKAVSEKIRKWFEKGATNIQTAWREILASCIVGLALSILAILLLRFFAGIIVWITVGIIVIGSITGTVLLWILWNDYRKSDSEPGYLAAAIIATVFTALLLLLLFAMRNRIRLVIQLFVEAGKAVASMPLLLLQPIWTLIIIIIVVGVWLGSWIPIQSSGEFVECKGDARLKMDTTISWMRIYHVLGFLWVVQFVIGCHLMTIAGAVAKWYFSRDKSRLGTPILTSMGNLIRYHLGSIAFGSLLIALVQLIRLILKYIEKKISGLSDTLTCVLKCCQCCLWCFEKFLKFLSRNAYIEIAIFGYSFCTGARKAFAILANNALRLGALNFVGEFVLFLVMLAVVCLTGTAGYYIIMTNKSIDSVVPGLVIVIVVTGLIVYCFVSIYDMTIDTLFVCFCEDCEQNDGVDKPYFMSRGLMTFVENSSKAIAAHDQRVRDAKNNNINTLQVQPNYQQQNDANVSHGKSGMTPLHPSYPPVSVPPSPNNFMPRPSD